MSVVKKKTFDALTSAMKTAFSNVYQSTVSPLAGQIAMEVPSSTKIEQYPFLGEAERLREWKGSRIVTRLQQYGYSLANRKFERTIGIDIDDLADNTLGMYRGWSESVGRAAAHWPSELVREALLAGETELCYDDQPFFDTEHPVGKDADVSLVSNLTAGGGNPWYVLDLSSGLRPFIMQMRMRPEMAFRRDASDSDYTFMHDEMLAGVKARGAAGFGAWQKAHKSSATLSEANVRTVITAMEDIQNDEDRKLGVRATHILVGTSNRFTATDLFGAELVDSGAGAGVDNQSQGLLQVIYDPYLP